jgi:hypothetical protein
MQRAPDLATLSSDIQLRITCLPGRLELSVPGFSDRLSIGKGFRCLTTIPRQASASGRVGLRSLDSASRCRRKMDRASHAGCPNASPESPARGKLPQPAVVCRSEPSPQRCVRQRTSVFHELAYLTSKKSVARVCAKKSVDLRCRKTEEVQGTLANSLAILPDFHKAVRWTDNPFCVLRRPICKSRKPKRGVHLVDCDPHSTMAPSRMQQFSILEVNRSHELVHLADVPASQRSEDLEKWCSAMFATTCGCLGPIERYFAPYGLYVPGHVRHNAGVSKWRWTKLSLAL